MIFFKNLLNFKSLVYFVYHKLLKMNIFDNLFMNSACVFFLSRKHMYIISPRFTHAETSWNYIMVYALRKPYGNSNCQVSACVNLADTCWNYIMVYALRKPYGKPQHEVSIWFQPGFRFVETAIFIQWFDPKRDHSEHNLMNSVNIKVNINAKYRKLVQHTFE